MEVAGLSPAMERRVKPMQAIAKAVHRRSKPFLGLSLVESVARRGPDGVPAARASHRNVRGGWRVRRQLAPWPPCPAEGAVGRFVARNGQQAYGMSGGGARLLLACSKAYASAISRGSAQALAVKVTPNGAGFASKPAGKTGVGALGTMPNGTATIG